MSLISHVPRVFPAHRSWLIGALVLILLSTGLSLSASAGDYSDREAAKAVIAAAEEAGVEVGDLIVAVESESIEDVGDLRRALRERDGQTFGLEVIRDGRPLSLTVTLPEREDDPRQAALRAEELTRTFPRFAEGYWRLGANLARAGEPARAGPALLATSRARAGATAIHFDLIAAALYPVRACPRPRRSLSRSAGSAAGSDPRARLP